MHHKNSAVETLRLEIDTLEIQLAHLKSKLVEAESSIPSLLPNPSEAVSCNADTPPIPTATSEQTYNWGWPLDPEEYKRYGRQMIMPEIGLEGWI